ncbi:TetR/AcrR family transcriptional regulator [Streptomyces sp. NBC_01235]|uniref:TetR/AcrR family transcriptional regulator n=1 Tax=Streptomyces sp. NBC_01235 TaxID=2903788 RepID=UPI002E0E0F4A|nr:TetR/AcrR family transcriptional regulator [Streptomyces sp. NBC_01235]
MTDSVEGRAAKSGGKRSGGKRQRLMAAAAAVLHERGVERTTIADIARAADVPVGNVYYYFKTKDELVEAALARHAEYLDGLTARLDELDDPRERLKSLVAGWVDGRDVAARYGCPMGTLAVELDKRDEGGLDLAAGLVIRRLLDWVERQYREIGVDGPDGHALALVGAYQGMSLLSSALRDPEVMTREGARLVREIDALA